MTPKKDMTWDDAIFYVLNSSEEPMYYKEIAEKIASDGLRVTLGATPANTVNSIISSSIKNDKEESRYLRILGGVYTVKNKLSNDQSVYSESENKDGIENQYRIITAFGMFWRRESVEWSQTTKLLGMAQLGAEAVDFSKQIGVYLLYDGREIIYAGRSADSLGKRLYEHTKDRLATRWDRFSWFGLLPIFDDGQIGLLPGTYKAENMIPALEAILIEALEPRQNRRRGDDLAAVEYLQKVDPEIEKKRIKATLDAALNKL